MAVSTKDIRNVVFLSHSSEGKTTLVENLLFKGGAILKAGTVDEKNTVSDFNDDEKERKSSINLSVAFYEKDGVKVNLLDAPGYLDYIGDAIAGISAADAFVMLVDAVGGIKVGTTKFWKIAKKYNLPGMIVVNKMDKENADFNKVVGDIQDRFGKSCVVLYSPVGKSSSFSGAANLLTKEGMDKLQGDDKARSEKLSSGLMEGVAESDDALLEKYLETGELPAAELAKALREGISTGKIIPIIPAAVAKGIGVSEIMAVIRDDFPSPADRAAVEGEALDGQEVNVETKAEDAFSGQVFKTISDPYAGQISILRVRSGKVSTNQTVKNISKEGSEKLGQLIYLKGKEQVHTDSSIAGDIVAVAKLKNTETNDTLTDDKRPLRFKNISFPEPAVSYSIKPKTKADEDKISNVLHKLTAEDPAFLITRDEQTHEMIVSGMGELHIRTMIARMKNRYSVDVDMGTPKIAYKETVSANGDAQYRHKKQSGGAGQFAEVWMKVAPLHRGDGFQFVDEVVGGAIPRPFIGSCEKGVKNALKEGILAGYPVVDVQVTVYDGKTHPVDSKDIAFQIAASHAFKESCQKAKPVLLEPIMNVEITISEESMGDVTGSLNTRRGRVLGMELEAGQQVVKAQVPLEEMYKYANELKSLTGDKATYTMTFSHYEIVPSNIAQKVVDASPRKHKKEEEE